MKDSTDIVIHINEKLDTEYREKLSNDVSHLGGVLSVKLAENRPHLMIVAYNPGKTKSLEVLSGVKNTGLHAQLVGWL